MKALTAEVCGVGFIGPGCDDWSQLGQRLTESSADETAFAATIVPALTTLPPAERRRVGTVVKLAIATGLQTCEQAGADPEQLSAVFASSGGDGHNCHQICETLAGSDRLISPIRFHNSVNNAAAGYWGIATGSQAPSSTISAYDGSFAAGLLEAVSQLHVDQRDQVLLIAYDVPYPEPLHKTRPMLDSMGVGMLLACPRSNSRRVHLRVSITDQQPQSMPDAGLEKLRLGIPAGRALPLLAAISAAQSSGRESNVVLEYLAGCHLAVEIGRGHD